MTPPPTAVVRPSITTPKMSMFFFTPVIAPEAANATVPMISSTSISVSKSYALPCSSGGVSIAT